MDTNGKLKAKPKGSKVDRATDSPSFVVGIGASAGGLESLEKLFRNLPTDTGMAFVVLQHFSPDFKSMMLELLGRDTSMTIHQGEDGMPGSAITTGVVDEILAPDAMGDLLAKISQEPQVTRKQRMAEVELRRDSLHGLDAIYHLFRRAHEIDFSVYKDTTVLRRIQRRVAMVGATSLDQYADQLSEDSQELNALYCDLLIYFQPAAQTRALSMFHYALKMNGIMMLGGSESHAGFVRSQVAIPRN